MDDFLTVAAVLLGAIALFAAVRFLTVLTAILRVSFWPAKVTTLIWQPALAADEEAAVAELEELGFTPVAADRIETRPLQYNAVLFQHAEDGGFAFLTFHALISSGFHVEFFSFTEDGRLLLTQNRALAIGSAPQISLADAMVDSLAQHWEFHKRRMTQEKLVSLPAEEVNRLTIDRFENLLPLLLDRKVVVKGHDGAFHPTFRSATRMAWTWWKARSKLAKPYKSPLTMGPVRNAFFARTYEQNEAGLSKRPPRHNVTALVIILSLVVSLALWGTSFTWGYAATLIGVLFVHEAGHAIAMRAFGYRNISMLFIPFFGALVTGTPKEIPAWKQAVVLLAGPLPGLLAALAFFLYRGFYPFETGFDYGRIAAIAAFINLFNLLPITPLDGGQLLEIALFSRWPAGRVIFAGLSAAALSLFAAYTKNPYLLPIIFFLWVNVVVQWRVADLQRAWIDGLSPYEQLHHLFETAGSIFGLEPFTRHYGLVRAVFNSRKICKPRAWESALVLAVLLTVWGGVGTAALAIWPQDRRVPAAASTDGRTAEQKAFDKVLDEMLDGAGATNLASLEEWAGKLNPSDTRHTDLAVLKALSLPFENRIRQLELFIKERKEGSYYNTAQIAHAMLWSIRQESAQKPAGEQIISLHEGFERLSQVWPENIKATVHLRASLARLMAKNGKEAEALEELQALKQALIDANAPPTLLAVTVRTEAWLYIGQEKPKVARALLEEALAKEMRDAPRLLAMDYAWALLFSGDIRAASQQMELAAYAPAPQSTFIQNALGANKKPKLQQPLDLAFAMMKEDKTAEAAEILAKDAPWACRRKPTQTSYELRDRAILSAYEAVCPLLKSSTSG